MSKKGDYNSLRNVFVAAMQQAKEGKGRERHSSGEPFDEQPICVITRWVGLGFPLGQAVKKCQEASKVSTIPAPDPDPDNLWNNLAADMVEAELLGAINYIAAAVIVLREGKKEDK